MKKRILVLEDDLALTRVLRDNLTFAGFEVDTALDGDEALRRLRGAPADLILLDVMLSGRSGFELCGTLRQGGQTPIIMVTARAQKADRVRGLELGADDYVTKPFYFEELLARIRAVLRRTRPSLDRLALGHVLIDFVRLQAWSAGREFHLTHREFEVLRYLAERPGRVVSRDELLREIWGYLDMPTTRSVDHAIARLRKKIEADPPKPRFLHTAHGDGYRLTIEAAADGVP